MTPRPLGLAVRLVRLWTRVYTLGMAVKVRDERLTEIECDLWECQHDSGRPARPIEILVRLLLGIPVFTVLPEQPGLKLESRRGPVDVLVIDRIEPPARE